MKPPDPEYEAVENMKPECDVKMDVNPAYGCHGDVNMDANPAYQATN